MLRKSRNFRVLEVEARADDAGLANRAGIALDSTESECGGHARNVACGLGIGERLVSRCGLQTIGVLLVQKSDVKVEGNGGNGGWPIEMHDRHSSAGVVNETSTVNVTYGDLALASRRSSVAKQTEDSVDDAIRVVLLEERVGDAENVLVSMFCN